MTRQVALVTGGQRGIGLGVSLALAAQGYAIAVASRSAPESVQVQQAMAQIAAVSDSQYFQFDVGNAANDAKELLERVEQRLGPVTTMVNNAGIGSPVRGDMLEVTPEAMDLVLGVNLKGGFFLAQAVAKRMLARVEAEQGTDSPVYQSISFVTSVSTDMVSHERSEYCISKAGASMMVKLFAVRLAKLGIGVFELRPGIIATDMTAGVKDKYDARIADGLVPANRWGRPEDIGQVIVPLARGDFAFSTGMSIPIDGALSIHRL